MRPFRLSLWCSVVMLVGASQAQAAWDNVFQVTCFGCKKKPVAVANYYAPAAPCPQPCPQPCQQPACTTQYYLRSYYQPVTTYRTQSYYEPVTTYRTSYYYEPVVSYRYSCYVDPCTGCSQQRAVPVTSYQMRAQTCPVTSYLQRCQLVPEQSCKLAYYWEPVTQCCQTTVGAPIYPNSPGGGVSEGQAPPGGGVSEGRSTLPNGPNGPMSYKPPVPNSQSCFVPQSPDNASYRQPALQPPVPVQQTPAKETQPPPTVRIDRIVKVDETPNVEGQGSRVERSQPAGVGARGRVRQFGSTRRERDRHRR